MSEVKDTASLDEKTVQKVARGEVKVHRAPRRASAKADQPDVHTSVKIDDRIMAVLDEKGVVLAAPNVEVVSPTEVIIWNPGVPRGGR